jgi:hypothetical protein
MIKTRSLEMTFRNELSNLLSGKIITKCDLKVIGKILCEYRVLLGGKRDESFQWVSQYLKISKKTFQRWQAKGKKDEMTIESISQDSIWALENDVIQKKSRQ